MYDANEDDIDLFLAGMLKKKFMDKLTDCFDHFGGLANSFASCSATVQDPQHHYTVVQDTQAILVSFKR